MVGIRVRGAEIGHSSQLVPLYRRGSPLTQVVHIACVHTDDKVEVEEIICCHRTRTVRQLIAAPHSVGTHTGIGQLTAMVGQNASRIYLKLSRQSGFFHQTAHHSLGSR